MGFFQKQIRTGFTWVQYQIQKVKWNSDTVVDKNFRNAELYQVCINIISKIAEHVKNQQILLWLLKMQAANRKWKSYSYWLENFRKIDKQFSHVEMWTGNFAWQNQTIQQKQTGVEMLTQNRTGFRLADDEIKNWWKLLIPSTVPIWPGQEWIWIVPSCAIDRTGFLRFWG